MASKQSAGGTTLAPQHVAQRFRSHKQDKILLTLCNRLKDRILSESCFAWMRMCAQSGNRLIDSSHHILALVPSHGRASPAVATDFISGRRRFKTTQNA
jgi:hypothetical protein